MFDTYMHICINYKIIIIIITIIVHVALIMVYSESLDTYSIQLQREPAKTTVTTTAKTVHTA